LTLRRELLRTLLLQGGGAAAMLLAVLWLAATAGPQVQGQFSRIKAEVDLVAALAMLGMPQALFFFLRGGRLSLARALRIAAAVALLALPLAWVWARLSGLGGALAWGLPVVAALAVLHGQWRTLLLDRPGSGWFNLATALPQVLLLVVAVGWSAMAAQGEGALLTGWALAYGLTLLLLAPRLFSVPHQPAPQAGAATPVAAAELLRYGGAAWAAAVLANLSIVLLLRTVDASSGAAALGLFTLAWTLAQLPLLPLNYAAPLLLRQWTGGAVVASVRRPALTVALSGLLLAVAAALLARWRDDIGFGAAYAGLGMLLAVLLLASAAEAVARLLVVRRHAAGRPWHATLAEAGRLLVLLPAWALGRGDLAALAWWWCAATVVSLAILAGLSRSAPFAVLSEERRLP